ncbi:MAG: LuxR C-terminal-related transcriptional regulator [Kiloniellales bacterium]|nr:LuxR C-terminal-related transcriptional regulator [Kiloniellales bacterium]
MKLESRNWHEEVAKVVSAEDTPQFPSVLVSALRCVVPFDFSVFFVYQGQFRPICVYDTFTPKQRIVFVEDYQEGPYLLDPFYKCCADEVKPGLYRLREIAPDRFYHSEYYRSYYRRTGLAEEIGFLVALDRAMMLVISLMRAGTSAPFSDRDFRKLLKVEPLIHATAARHWKNPEYLRDHHKIRKADGIVPESPVTTALEKFGDGILTTREGEVVRMVLRGHSSESIGRQFSISTGTVKIHRRNIYAKLGVSSQSELFSLFISGL